MVFKLVRLDKGEPLKIQLQVGKNVIGRGRFPHNDDADIDDNRVARNHAELEVTEDTITLKALHQNPCYYKRLLTNKETMKAQPVQQNSTFQLSNGDQFGLTPDTFWYEVIYYAEQDIHESGTACQEESAQGSAVNAQGCGVSSCTSKKRANDSHISSPGDLKKVKTEPHAPDAEDAKPPINEQAVPDQNIAQIPNIDAPPPQPLAPLREKCLYGANCCRRNPEHMEQYSHPLDNDWELPPHLAAERAGIQVFRRRGYFFFIQAQSVMFFDNHIQIEDDGDTLDYDY